MEILNYEACIIMRRRHGFRQDEIAHIWRVNQSTVSKWEHGFGTCPIHESSIKNLSLGEQVFLMRRRLEWTQEQAAQKFKMNRYTIWFYEKDSEDMSLFDLHRSRSYFKWLKNEYKKSRKESRS